VLRPTPVLNAPSLHDALPIFAHAGLLGIGDMGAEPDRTLLQPVADDLFQPRERAAADEQDVGRIHLQEFLLRMLAATLRRNAGRSEEHTSELQSRENLVCRLL